MSAALSIEIRSLDENHYFSTLIKFLEKIEIKLRHGEGGGGAGLSL
jgi:hypothetical protein